MNAKQRRTIARAIVELRGQQSPVGERQDSTASEGMKNTLQINSEPKQEGHLPHFMALIEEPVILSVLTTVFSLVMIISPPVVFVSASLVSLVVYQSLRRYRVSVWAAIILSVLALGVLSKSLLWVRSEILSKIQQRAYVTIDRVTIEVDPQTELPRANVSGTIGGETVESGMSNGIIVAHEPIDKKEDLDRLYEDRTLWANSHGWFPGLENELHPGSTLSFSPRWIPSNPTEEVKATVSGDLLLYVLTESMLRDKWGPVSKQRSWLMVHKERKLLDPAHMLVGQLLKLARAAVSYLARYPPESLRSLPKRPERLILPPSVNPFLKPSQ